MRTTRYLFLAIVVVCVNSTANAQSLGRSIIGDNIVVHTEGGNRLELSFYTHRGNNIVSVCDWYKNIGQNEIHFSSIGNNISVFKSDLIVLQSKYEQWIITAKMNEVQEVEKEIPCTINYSVYDCDAYAGNATKVIVKPYFVVKNYVPHCEIRIWQFFYDRTPPNYNVWYLSPKDIPFLLAAIDKGYQEYISKSTQKQSTEDLFK